MPDKRAGVGVAFNTMAFHQHDPVLRRFAEVVTAIGGDRDHGALQRAGEQEHQEHGPAAKPGDTLGSSSGTNSTVQQQDTSNVKGLRGNNSGPAAKKPDQK
ncbi:hypothetical protein ABIF64_000599 [Bradyrhizobium japonicum]|uniref:hypothetical protein n=1 Tax=Bradyrhizobium japonicum TaxID=375 RepID=UPI0033974DA9